MHQIGDFNLSRTLHAELSSSGGGMHLARVRYRVVSCYHPHAHVHETVAGNLLYMAPECFLRQTFSCSSDVYAFGILLWELLTLCIPYAATGYSPALVASKVASEGLRPVLPPLSAVPQQVLCWNQYYRFPSRHWL